jgi:hypothetical protein
MNTLACEQELLELWEQLLAKFLTEIKPGRIYIG